jgi:hypothetical protein
MADKLCFVIGPIGRDGSRERKYSDLLLNVVIKHVLQGDDLGYRVKRADEDDDPGMITNRMILDIIHADLVVADLTDLNANAFYELGIRHSTERPVIHLARYGTPLPFDTATHRTIFVDLTEWQSIVRCRSQLARSARAIQDPEFRVSNPITQANASFKMRESADPRDLVLVQLQDRMRALEAKISKGYSDQQSPDSGVVALMQETISRGLAARRTAREICNDINYAIIHSGFVGESYMCEITTLGQQLTLHLKNDNNLIWTATLPADTRAA